MIRPVILVCLALGSCGSPQPEQETETVYSFPDVMVSGTEYLKAETQELQADAFANPGLLWAEKGKALFTARDGAEKACIDCHGGDVRITTAATRYPQINPKTGLMINLEQRINLCRAEQQNQTPLPYEHEDLLALTTYVASRARGQKIARRVSPETQASFDAGQDYFYGRRGQFNLSCAQCHNDNAGKQLRGDTISQGHGNGFPAYRFEWEALGSLHRRFADCDTGVRAAPQQLGSQVYTDLEYYLSVRASGLTIETPAVRR